MSAPLFYIRLPQIEIRVTFSEIEIEIEKKKVISFVCFHYIILYCIILNLLNLNLNLNDNIIHVIMYYIIILFSYIEKIGPPTTSNNKSHAKVNLVSDYKVYIHI